MEKIMINENNVNQFVGRKVRVSKSDAVIEGVVKGRSTAIVTDADGNPVHPIAIETPSTIEVVLLDDGWKVEFI
jgi:hypothetical protein